MAKETVRVRGLREFQRAAARGGKKARAGVRAALREAAEPVRATAVSLFSPVNAASAAGYRVAVRQRGVAVESRRRRTTGKHPEYGALQMRTALLPALARHEHDIEARVEHALDRIADHFERKP